MSKVKDKNDNEVFIGYVLKTPYNEYIIATRVDEEYLHWVDAEHSNCSGGTHAKEDFYDDMCPECEGVRPTGCETCGGRGQVTSSNLGVDSYEVVASSVKDYIQKCLSKIFDIL